MVESNSESNETYIAFGVVDHICSIRFTDVMPQDLNKLIEKIKASAVDRCRDRLDAAACKARGSITSSTTENRKNFPSGIETHGVTSSYKKRHGL
jgi:CBS-domain-containing membrane protein